MKLYKMKFFETSAIAAVGLETHRNSEYSILKFWGENIMSRILKFLSQTFIADCIRRRDPENSMKFHAK